MNKFSNETLTILIDRVEKRLEQVISNLEKNTDNQEKINNNLIRHSQAFTRLNGVMEQIMKNNDEQDNKIKELFKLRDNKFFLNILKNESLIKTIIISLGIATTMIFAGSQNTELFDKIISIVWKH